jgi:hypothetical protein
MILLSPTIQLTIRYPDPDQPELKIEDRRSRKKSENGKFLIFALNDFNKLWGQNL